MKSSGHWNNISVGLLHTGQLPREQPADPEPGTAVGWHSHTYEANNVMSNFYPNLYNPANAAVLNPGDQWIGPSSRGLRFNYRDPDFAGLPLDLNGVGICGESGLPAGCMNGAWKDFGPRLALSPPFDGLGQDGDPWRLRDHVRARAGQRHARTSQGQIVPFAAGVSFPNILLSNPGTSVLTGSTVSALKPVSSIVGMDQNNYAAPRSTQFSMGIQHSIGKSVLSVTYVGTQKPPPELLHGDQPGAGKPAAGDDHEQHTGADLQCQRADTSAITA